MSLHNAALHAPLYKQDLYIHTICDKTVLKCGIMQENYIVLNRRIHIQHVSMNKQMIFKQLAEGGALAAYEIM